MPSPFFLIRSSTSFRARAFCRCLEAPATLCITVGLYNFHAFALGIALGAVIFHSMLMPAAARCDSAMPLPAAASHRLNSPVSLLPLLLLLFAASRSLLPPAAFGNQVLLVEIIPIRFEEEKKEVSGDCDEPAVVKDSKVESKKAESGPDNERQKPMRVQEQTKGTDEKRLKQ